MKKGLLVLFAAVLLAGCGGDSENIDKQRSKCYAAVKELLDFATKYGWNHNLWQCLLTFFTFFDCSIIGYNPKTIYLQWFLNFAEIIMKQFIKQHGLEIIPITNMAKITFHDLIGYESQKEELAKNTERNTEASNQRQLLRHCLWNMDILILIHIIAISPSFPDQMTTIAGRIN